MKKIILGITCFVFSSLLFANPETIAEKQFINQMVQKNHFSRAALNHLFYELHPNYKIIQSMTQPFEKRPWTFYRNYFITQKRIALGAQYLKTHHHELMAMQRKYGIPATIITAIIGVETEYGEHLGKYSVLQTLYTLGFYYPPREKFFRSEFAQYLILTRNNQLPMWQLKGSYAGALGIPQFMPSSYRYYGVSAHHDGNVNLFNNDDAIASVANYFHKMGWQANQPIAYHLRSRYSPISEGAKRLVLPRNHGNSYWETFHNFKVILSYNHNNVYAMAVYQLSRAIQKYHT